MSALSDELAYICEIVTKQELESLAGSNASGRVQR